MPLDCRLPELEAGAERERLLPLLEDVDLLGLPDRVFDGGRCGVSLLFEVWVAGVFPPLTGAVMAFLPEGAETMLIPLAVEPELTGPVFERLCLVSER